MPKIAITNEKQKKGADLAVRPWNEKYLREKVSEIPRKWEDLIGSPPRFHRSPSLEGRKKGG